MGFFKQKKFWALRLGFYPQFDLVGVFFILSKIFDGRNPEANRLSALNCSLICLNVQNVMKLRKSSGSEAAQFFPIVIYRFVYLVTSN